MENRNNMTNKAIIIGASSGIGKELSKVLSQNNYIVGLVGRRTQLLDELKEELIGEIFMIFEKFVPFFFGQNSKVRNET